jgi:hypothetical protein
MCSIKGGLFVIRLDCFRMPYNKDATKSIRGEVICTLFLCRISEKHARAFLVSPNLPYHVVHIVCSYTFQIPLPRYVSQDADVVDQEEAEDCGRHQGIGEIVSD